MSDQPVDDISAEPPEPFENVLTGDEEDVWVYPDQTPAPLDDEETD